MFRINFDGMDDQQVIDDINRTCDYLGSNQDQYGSNWRWKYKDIVIEQLINSRGENFKKLAVQDSGKSIQYIKNPNVELQTIAVDSSYNGYPIKFIENPARSVVLLALEKAKNHDFDRDNETLRKKLIEIGMFTPALIYYAILKHDIDSHLYYAIDIGMTFSDKFWMRIFRRMKGKFSSIIRSFPPHLQIELTKQYPNLLCYIKRDLITDDLIDSVYHNITHPIAGFVAAAISTNEEVKIYLSLKF